MTNFRLAAPAAVGIALGIGLAGLLSTALGEFFFDIDPRDPATFTAIGGVLMLTGLAACLVPARRAAAVDPMVALRCQ